MKLKEGFLLHRMAGEAVVIPADEDMDLHVMVTLNPAGELLWRLLEQGTDTDALVAALLDKYDVDEATARADVLAFLETMESRGFLE